MYKGRIVPWKTGWIMNQKVKMKGSCWCHVNIKCSKQSSFQCPFVDVLVQRCFYNLPVRVLLIFYYQFYIKQIYQQMEFWIVCFEYFLFLCHLFAIYNFPFRGRQEGRVVIVSVAVLKNEAFRFFYTVNSEGPSKLIL